MIAFWIRIQGIQRIPNGQFTANDAYLYYWNAKQITAHGYLPAIDKHRWIPNGRNEKQTLHLYPYALVYTHKLITLFFHKVSLYDIQLYAPAVCFTLGLGIFALFLYHTTGGLFAFIVTLLLATLPGSVDRSAAGFSDRDAWCWMLGTLAVVSYLWKKRIPFKPQDNDFRNGDIPTRLKSSIRNWRRYLATALSGGIVFLGGLSWEGFGVFLLVILVTELWQFCKTNTEEHLLEYIVWITMFVPTLYLISPAYRDGLFFATHLTALVLVPPLGILALRVIRYILLHFLEPIRAHARKLAAGLTVMAIAAAGIYVWGQLDTFATTTVPFSENRLMQQTSELHNPSFQYWVSRYGGVCVIGSIGLSATCCYIWKWKALTLATGLAMFTTTIFIRAPISQVIGEKTCEAVGIAAVAIAIIGTALVGTKKNISKNEDALIATIYWCLLWTGLAKIAIRYDFFIGIPLAIGTAAVLTRPHTTADTMKIMGKTVNTKIVTAATALGMTAILLFWTPAGGYAKRAINVASQRQPLPGNNNLAQAYTYMKKGGC